MHELSLAGAVLGLRLPVPAVPAVEPCPLSSGCEHRARALGGSLVPWHTVALPCRARGAAGLGLEWEQGCWCCLPGVLLCAQSHAGEIWVCTLTPQCPCPVLPLLSHSLCAPVPAGFGCIPGAVPGVILLGPPSPCCCHHSPCGTKHKVGASISRSPAPASSPVDDLVLKAWALALGEGSRDKIISASS